MTSFFSIQKKFDKDLKRRDIDQEFEQNYLLTSLYFSQLAYFSYDHIADKLAATHPISFSVYSKGGVQVMFAEFQTFAVVAFKGQANDRLCEVWTDLKFWKTEFEGIQVHAGQAQAYKNVNRRILIDLDEVAAKKRILYTGHSLGGGLAMLLALQHKPTDICTFGSPRITNPENVGDRYEGIDITRVFTENDFVSFLPPLWAKYEHIGKEVMLEGKKSSWDAHQLSTYLKRVVGKKIISQ